MQADYLSKISHSDTGFQVTALVHSVPQALALWAGTLTCLQVCIWVISQATGIAQPPLTCAIMGSIIFGLCVWEGATAYRSAKQGDGDINLEKT